MAPHCKTLAHTLSNLLSQAVDLLCSHAGTIPQERAANHQLQQNHETVT